MLTSDVIASLSFIVSLGTLAWTYFKDKKDLPALQVTAKIVNEYDTTTGVRGPDLFSLYMVNTGSRRIYLRGWYMKQRGPEHDGAFLQNQRIPPHLEPGAHHTEIIPGITFLHDSITSIYVSDSTDKEWPIKKTNLQHILRQVAEIRGNHGS